MADYLYCTSDRRTPEIIRIGCSRDDPRLEISELARRIRKGEPIVLEWSVRVINHQMSEQALQTALQPYVTRRYPGAYCCDPMTARGEAIKFTTLRPADPKAKQQQARRRSWFARLFPEVLYRRSV